jgi:hypothetical protein
MILFVHLACWKHEEKAGRTRATKAWRQCIPGVMSVVIVCLTISERATDLKPEVENCFVGSL